MIIVNDQNGADDEYDDDNGGHANHNDGNGGHEDHNDGNVFKMIIMKARQLERLTNLKYY